MKTLPFDPELYECCEGDEVDFFKNGDVVTIKCSCCDNTKTGKSQDVINSWNDDACEKYFNRDNKNCSCHINPPCSACTANPDLAKISKRIPFKFDGDWTGKYRVFCRNGKEAAFNRVEGRFIAFTDIDGILFIYRLRNGSYPGGQHSNYREDYDLVEMEPIDQEIHCKIEECRIYDHMLSEEEINRIYDQEAIDMQSRDERELSPQELAFANKQDEENFSESNARWMAENIKAKSLISAAIERPYDFDRRGVMNYAE